MIVVSGLATLPSSPAFAQVTPGQAQSEGYSDGSGDGAREGYEAGPYDGRNDGEREGRQAGFDRCERDEKQKAYDEGYRSGVSSGTSDGRSRGDSDGQSEGDKVGRKDGRVDGLGRADRDARSAAWGPGSVQGERQAQASDAAERGQADGLVEGDRDAYSKAQQADYPRGRQDERDARFAEPIQNRDAFSQRPTLATPALSLGALEEVMGSSMARAIEALPGLEPLRRSGSPSRRYYNPRRNYNDPGLNAYYLQGYQQGYDAGFHSAYGGAYDSAYRSAYSSGERDGCYDAQRRSYSSDQERGRKDGYDSAYRSAYDSAYRPAYDRAYNSGFRVASENAYRERYDRAYDEYYEEARADAYRRRYNEIYQSAYAPAHRAKYNEMYPGYAQAAYAKGRREESMDFADRPVRLLEAAITETIPNGLFEPGEALRVTTVLRNFADQDFDPRDVELSVESLDASAAVIPEAKAYLMKGLRAKSLTTVTEALEIRFQESAANRTKALRVRATFRGKNIGQIDLQVTPRFVLAIEVTEKPRVLEGLPTGVKVRVTNQSKVATDPSTKLTLSSDSNAVELVTRVAAVGALASGASRDLEFQVIGRSGLNEHAWPVAWLAQAGDARRIGVLTLAPEVPVVNEYRIQLTNESDLSALRRENLVRLRYRIRDVGSRVLLRGIQVQARVLGATASSISFAGPMPQYLPPMQKGQSVEFTLPVLVKAANAGGTLELEVQEDGQAAVIHRVNF